MVKMSGGLNSPDGEIVGDIKSTKNNVSNFEERAWAALSGLFCEFIHSDEGRRYSETGGYLGAIDTARAHMNTVFKVWVRSKTEENQAEQQDSSDIGLYFAKEKWKLLQEGREAFVSIMDSHRETVRLAERKRPLTRTGRFVKAMRK
jgi:hypothetical protein